MRIPLLRRTWHINGDFLVTRCNGREHRVRGSELGSRGFSHPNAPHVIWMEPVGVNGDDDEPVTGLAQLPSEVQFRIIVRFLSVPTDQNRKAVLALSATSTQLRRLLSTGSARTGFYQRTFGIARRSTHLPPMPPQGGFPAWYRRFLTTWVVQEHLRVQIEHAAIYWFRLWYSETQEGGDPEYADEMRTMFENQEARRFVRENMGMDRVPESSFMLAQQVKDTYGSSFGFYYLVLYGLLLVRVDDSFEREVLRPKGLSLADLDAIVMPRNLHLLGQRWSWNRERDKFAWESSTIHVVRQGTHGPLWLFFSPVSYDERKEFEEIVHLDVHDQWYNTAKPNLEAVWLRSVELSRVRIEPGFPRKVPRWFGIHLTSCRGSMPFTLDLEQGPQGVLDLTHLVLDRIDYRTIRLPDVFPYVRGELTIIHRPRLARAQPLDLEGKFVRYKRKLLARLNLKYVSMTKVLLLRELKKIHIRSLSIEMPRPRGAQEVSQALEDTVAELIRRSLFELELVFNPPRRPEEPFSLPARLTERRRTDTSRRDPLKKGEPLLNHIRLNGAGLSSIPDSILEMPWQKNFTVNLRFNVISRQSVISRQRDLVRLFGPTDAAGLRVLDLRNNRLYYHRDTRDILHQLIRVGSIRADRSPAEEEEHPGEGDDDDDVVAGD